MCDGPYHFHCGGKISLITLFLWVASVVALVLFFGCNRKSSCEPVWETPTQAIENEIDQAAINSSALQFGDWPEEDWWTRFQDSTLDALIISGLGNNPRIKIADAQARLSLAEAHIVRSTLFPHLFAAGDITRYRASKTGVFGIIPQQAALFPFSYTQTEFSLNLSYDFDLWGKNRNELKAAIGEVQADVAEAAVARLMLSVSIAQAYFQLQTALAREAVAERLAANNDETLQLVQHRSQNHVDSAIQVQNQERDVYVARDFLAALRQEVNLRRHALHALVAGQWDETIPPIALEQATYAPLSIPTDLPFDLVAHRPEITAQLWRIDAAANRAVVARKDFYPNINLIGLIGQQTLISNTLFKDKSKYGQIGPAIHLPIFEGGRLIANVDATEEEYCIAILRYEDLLIQAVKEVLQNISDVYGWNERLEENTHRLDSIQKNYDLFLDRVRHNISSQLDVLTIERNLLSARDTLIQTKAALILAELNLIKSLGGGFEGCH